MRAAAAFILALTLVLPLVSDVRAAGSAAESDQIIQINDQQPAGSELIELSKGQTIEFCISSNPTTGYTWQISGVDEALLELLRNDYQVQGPGIGAGGVRTVVYRAKADGECTIQMIHCRSWQCEQTTVGSYKARITIR
ncbi:MAG: protease inhibitor I42 family protein [Candidatus Alcyoniella australis]|nr:protease inhibitor I42 family protein [Candidatus Alcyoniella australis]